MANQNSNSENMTIDQIREELGALKENCNDLIEEIRDAKENQEQDLFAALEFLRLNDQLAKLIFNSLKDLKNFLSQISSQKEKESNQAQNLINQIKDFRSFLQERWLLIDEEYPLRADKTLRKAQDLVTQFADTISTDELIPSLQTQITQNLDKEQFLQELRDTLESYRQERESYISDVEMNSLRKLAEIQIPEDLGEETPEEDAILSQLDTLITSCDMALMKNEIEE